MAREHGAAVEVDSVNNYLLVLCVDMLQCCRKDMCIYFHTCEIVYLPSN